MVWLLHVVLVLAAERKHLGLPIDVPGYNALITGERKGHDWEAAVHVLAEMQRAGVGAPEADHFADVAETQRADRAVRPRLDNVDPQVATPLAVDVERTRWVRGCTNSGIHLRCR